LEQSCAQVEKFPIVARRRKSDVTEVMVEVEFGVGDPHRRREAAEHRCDAFAEPRDVGGRSGNAFAEHVGVEGRVADDDRADIGAEPWIVLDVPHHRFGVTHLVLEAQLPLIAHAGPLLGGPSLLLDTMTSHVADDDRTPDLSGRAGARA
jgi:hypothetical protein